MCDEIRDEITRIADRIQAVENPDFPAAEAGDRWIDRLSPSGPAEWEIRKLLDSSVLYCRRFATHLIRSGNKELAAAFDNFAVAFDDLRNKYLAESQFSQPPTGIDKSELKFHSIRIPTTRDEIESFAQETFAVSYDRILEQFPQKWNSMLNQARSTGNSGAFAPAVTGVATERVRVLILALADAYVDAFTICGAPSDAQAEATLQKSADQFAAGAISAVHGQANLDSVRTRSPERPIPGLARAMQQAVNSALKEGKLRLKEQRIKFRNSANPSSEVSGWRNATPPAPASEKEDPTRHTPAPVRKGRGRPQKISDETKAAATKLKSEGATNKGIAALIYDNPYPSDQQRRNVPGILRHYHQKLERSNRGKEPSKGASRTNKYRG